MPRNKRKIDPIPEHFKDEKEAPVESQPRPFSKSFEACVKFFYKAVHKGRGLIK